MRERDINRKLFHKGHYEIIAKQFREALVPIFEAEQYFSLGGSGMKFEADSNREQLNKTSYQSGVIVDLAISMAKRFALDNEDFKPELFLDRCSPDSDLYPLSELWQGVNQSELVDD